MRLFGKVCLVMAGDGIVLFNYSIFPGCRNNDFSEKKKNNLFQMMIKPFCPLRNHQPNREYTVQAQF